MASSQQLLSLIDLSSDIYIIFLVADWTLQRRYSDKCYGGRRSIFSEFTYYGNESAESPRFFWKSGLYVSEYGLGGKYVISSARDSCLLESTRNEFVFFDPFSVIGRNSKRIKLEQHVILMISVEPEFK